MPQHGSLRVLELGLAKTQLNSFVAVLRQGLDLGDCAGAGLDDGNRNGLAPGAENLGHAYFSAQQSIQHVYFSRAAREQGAKRLLPATANTAVAERAPLDAYISRHAAHHAPSRHYAPCAGVAPGNWLPTRSTF